MAAMRSASGISSFSDPRRLYSKSGRITRGRRLPTARSMAERSLSSSGETKVKASPVSSARRAPDPVDVVVGHGRHVEIDDVAEGFHVDAAGGDVGGDQDPDAAALEGRERRRPLRLAPVAVDALTGDAVAREEVRQPVGAVLGAREDQGALHVAALDQLQQQGGLDVLGDRVHRLRDADGGRGLALEVDRGRIAQQLSRQRLWAPAWSPRRRASVAGAAGA
jgi:hypothetical protein